MYQGRVIIEFPSMEGFGLRAAMASRRVKVIKVDLETGNLTPLPHVVALKLNIAFDGIVTASVTRFVPTGNREEPARVEYADYVVAEVRVSEKPDAGAGMNVVGGGGPSFASLLQRLRKLVK